MDYGYTSPPPLPPPMGWSDSPPPPPPPEPPQRPPAHRSPWFWLMVTCATVVLLSAGGVGIAALAHHDPGAHSVTAPGSTAPAATAPATAASSVGEWFTEVSTDYTAVATDWTAVGNESGVDLSGIVTACTQLDTDVQTLQSDAPMPDPTMNAVYQDALTNSAEFATGCVASAADVNTAELAAALPYETKALSDFDQLNGLLKQP